MFKIKFCIVDYRTSGEEINTLKHLGFHSLLCPKNDTFYEAVDGHPDMQIFISPDKTLLIQKNMDSNFIGDLKGTDRSICLSTHELGEKYPYNILLNCFTIGDLFVHNLKYTDPSVLKFVESKKKINVKQGYSKCSTAVLNENAVITNDRGIAGALTEEKIDVLFLPYGDIELKGFDYGFIGGSCGLLDNHSMAFFGNLEKYKYGKEVLGFLKKHGVEPYFLSDSRLSDRGTLFSI